MQDAPDTPTAAPGAGTAWAGRRVLRVFLCLVAGGLAGLGHVPFSLPFVALAGLTLGLTMIATAAPTARSGFATAWWFGTGYFLATLFWIIEPFQVDPDRHGWMAPFALFFMATGLALFWGVAGAVAVAGSRTQAGRLVAMALALSLTEIARGYVMTGFPWALVAYIWTESGVRGWATLVGSYGLSFLTLALAALASAVLLGPQRLAKGAVLLVSAGAFFVIGPTLLPQPKSEDGRPVVRLIQPNAAQDEKWDLDMIPVFLDRQILFTGARSGGTPPDLIVWPETAIPYMLDAAPNTLARIAEAAGGPPVVIGAQRRDGPTRRAHNSLAVIQPGGDISAVYDKHHLVPFGEYMPFRGLSSRLGLKGVAELAGGGYWPGPGPEVIDLGAAGVGLPLICYEAIFPQDIHAAAVRPDFLLQLTNDAWFGNFAGPFQHLAQARMRAVEQGLPMARSANTGVSAMIDAGGRITAQVPLGVPGYIDAVLPPPEPPTLYSRLKDWPIALLLGLCLVVAIFRRFQFRD